MTMQSFNMNDVQARVSETIKAQFALLIPDEMWDGMVKRETGRFIETELPKLVKAELEVRVREAIAVTLDGPEYHSKIWTQGGQKPTDVVLEITRQLAPEMIQAMFGNVVQDALVRVRSGLAQSGIQPRF